MAFDHFPCTEAFYPHTYTFHITCLVCKQVNDITLPANELLDYHQGTLIQFAFPRLSESERELLISNICPKCWDDTFYPCTCTPDSEPCEACRRKAQAKYGDTIPY